MTEGSRSSHSAACPNSSMPEITRNTLFQGKVLCYQHKHGYRFSVDAVLVAHFCKPSPAARVLDIGCGCGVIGLILCSRYARLTVTGLELQSPLARLTRKNIAANQLEERFTVCEGDLCQVRTTDQLKPESFDLVVTNPPYHKTGTGRLNNQDEQAIARHELTADPDSVMAAAAYCVKNRGSVVCVYPATRLVTVITAMEQHRLTVKRVQPVYSYPEDNRARLVLIEAVKNGGEEITLLPPLYIYQYPDGSCSADVDAMYHLEKLK